MFCFIRMHILTLDCRCVVPWSIPSDAAAPCGTLVVPDPAQAVAICMQGDDWKGHEHVASRLLKDCSSLRLFLTQ